MTDRRQFITGSAALVAASTIPASVAAAPADRTEWDAAMRKMQEADAACDAYYRNVVQPLEDALEARLRSNGVTKGTAQYDEKRREVVAKAHDYHAAHDELERLCDVFCDAQSALLDMPAPDAEALRWKLDKVLEPCHGGTQSWSWSYVAQTVEDYRRLLG
ncbi:hypothetical protein [Aurantiacibacter zhengii]|uniref:Twin-arginine translocation signal domain-containing protein n=1 Tax=Aurantiacibacter zhengii TaxID=2307003 RepID=A0A418NNF9_9SPHN|nr:hypothetical protein [Aurantiacibacter zhengii]RIV83372.1 hypothetical protein D2V07_16620 [Aurantiacibacter zhengii]